MQGRLSAVHQLAAEIGSAVVPTRPLQHRREHGGADAMPKSILVVVGIVAICLRLSWAPAAEGRSQPSGRHLTPPQAKALTPVMSRPTISVCMVSVPS
jgi:hypothetical protein